MFAVLGLLGVLVAGMIVIDPFGSEADENIAAIAPEDDIAPQDRSNLSDSGNLLDDTDEVDDSADTGASDFPGFSEASESVPGNGSPSEGPDHVDQVYGHNIGDQMGANLFQQLLFSDDAITGASGDDAINGGAQADLTFGNEGDDTIETGDGDDMSHGDDGDDLILAGTGNDATFGGDGHDEMHGNSGNDLIVGGEGNDTLVGGAGADKLFGQFGADFMDGGAGNDTLDGTQARSVSAPGNDEDAGDTLSGGAGDDLLILGADDLASGGDGQDTFVTGDYIDDGSAPIIDDFDPDGDILEILVDPEDIGASELTSHSANGGVEIHLNGVAIAQITNLENLDLSLVKLVPSSAA